MRYGERRKRMKDIREGLCMGESKEESGEDGCLLGDGNDPKKKIGRESKLITKFSCWKYT